MQLIIFVLVDLHGYGKKRYLTTLGLRSRAVVHTKRLYSLYHFTKVGLSVFLLFWPVFI